MSARRFALFGALALFIMFVAANITANSWFRSWRLDLTENQLYSLSPGTQTTLDGLTEPVELTLYYSRDAAAPVPQLQTYAARVREMLQTFQARSHGRVRFVEIDVERYSEQEDDAVEAGIEPVTPFQGADPIYFGLTGANAINDQRTIPLFDPQREAFLEYEITRLIFELEHPARTRVALISSLPLDPAIAAAAAGRPSGQSTFAAEMGRLMEVTKLPPNFHEIPDVDVLAIIHPGALTQSQLYAIDQFVLRKGRAFIAVDPAALSAEQSGGFDPFNATGPAPASSNLQQLLSRWGVTMAPTVVLDLDGALPVQVQDPTSGQTQNAPQPLFFQVPAEHLDRHDLMTAWLQRGINFGLAGGLSWSEENGVEVTPLVRTSGNTMRMSAAEALARPSPYEVVSMWPQGGGRIETVALRLSGNLETAFPNGRPAEEAPAPETPLETPPETPPQTPNAQAPPAQPSAGGAAPGAQLRRSAAPAEIVVVADVDFLADDFYVDPRSGGSAADNGAFALNAIDVLSGSNALVSLRSRAPSSRRMELLDNMERDAQRRIERRTDELQGELQETESRLAQLQSRGRGSGFFSGDLGAELTPEENTEIERFRNRVVQVRSELRNTERNLRGDVNQLEAFVVFVNIWLAPILVAAAGVFLFWRRQRRRRAR
jgi:ABC-type uncharacterized transport system involved in gliding motility auxiliary subunit